MKLGARLISSAMLALAVSAAFASAPTTDALLSKAKAQAKMEHKQVLVIWHASWCGWCHKLDDMLESKEVGPTMSKGFVVVHLIVDEDPKHKADENPGAVELRKTLGGEKAGLPFYVVMDAKGKAVANSLDEKGQNIGYPAAPQEIAHFMGMLKGSTLSASEQTSVGAYLKDVAVKQHLVPTTPAGAGGGR